METIVLPICRALDLGQRTLAHFAGRLGRLLSRRWEKERSDTAAQAEATALRLLQDVLSTGASQLTQQGYLDVRSRVFADVVYRLRLGEPVEVYERGGDVPAGRLCVVVRASVPPADALLAKALWLRTNELEFLRIGQRLA